MAIKVKHEGNVTSRIVAAAKGGRGKRAAEEGKAWMQIAAQEAMAGNRQLTGAHASPVAPGHASAPLTHAPTGSAPGMMHAPSGGGGGGGRRGAGSGSSFRSGSGGGGGDLDLKVTGTDIFTRPDKESVWDNDTRQWKRRWLPGEKEAEAQQRVGDVKNAQQMALDESRDELARQQFEYKLSAEQKNELAKINSAMEDARRSGRFSDEELGELERQAAAKRMGIKPLPVPKEEAPKPIFHTDENGQRWIQNGQKWEPVQTPAAPQSVEDVYAGTKVDEQGRRWGLDKSGKLYEVGGGGKDEFSELLKMVPTTKPDPEGGPDIPLTPEERLAKLEELRQMRDKFNAPKQPAPSTGNFFAFGMPTWDAELVHPVARPGETGGELSHPVARPGEAGGEMVNVNISERDKKWSAFKGN